MISVRLRCRALLVLAVLLSGLRPVSGAESRPNVLFIAIDDLRSDLGVLGVKHARTPNLDRFAASGRLFTHHYAVVPTCGASRCALIRGRYPEVPEQVGNEATRLTHDGWAAQSLPAWWRSHGYQTLAVGKITHYPGNRTGRNWAEGPEELPGAWDRTWIPKSPWATAEEMMHGYANGQPRVPGKSPPWQMFDGPDEAYPDAWVASDAVRTLRELAVSDRPWFFAVGLFKPHLPFAAPKKWFDLHDPKDIAAPAVTSKPAGDPSGWHPSGEFRGNYRDAAGRDPGSDPAYALELRRAYAAATSYVDAQVGRVLDTLRELRLEQNTIVVIWSDHGFLLGEHAIWGKHTLYENGLRSPLMIRVPGMKRPGEKSDALVEAVDLYPTLLEYCHLPSPGAMDGRSLQPQLENPAAPTVKPARGFWSAGDRTIRTERWRLIAHRVKDSPVPKVELFDMIADPNEARNVAANEPAVVKELLASMNAVKDPFPAKR
jgi:iduronate 2-sulfatase